MPKDLLPEAVSHYLLNTFVQESDGLRRLREETSALPEAGYQITPDQGQFLSLLVRLIQAKNTLEIGVFTGYSSLCILTALPEDGKHVALDVNHEYAATAKSHWEAAGVADKVELIVAPAMDSLDILTESGREFDFCFIDADKPNYCGYYERVIQLLRPNGLVVIDNTLWRGQVADSADMSESTVAIRQVNEMAASDPRVDASLIPLGDGLLIVRKR